MFLYNRIILKCSPSLQYIPELQLTPQEKKLNLYSDISLHSLTNNLNPITKVQIRKYVAHINKPYTKNTPEQSYDRSNCTKKRRRKG